MAATVEQVVQRYSGDEDRPLPSFVGLMAANGAATAGLGVATEKECLPEQVPVRDLALLAANDALQVGHAHPMEKAA